MNLYKQRRFPFDERCFEFNDTGSLRYTLKTLCNERIKAIDLASISPEPVAYKERNNWNGLFAMAACALTGVLLVDCFEHYEKVKFSLDGLGLIVGSFVLTLGFVFNYFRLKQSGLAFLYRGTEQIAFTLLGSDEPLLVDFIQEVRRRHYQSELQELERDTHLVLDGIDKLNAAGFIDKDKRQHLRFMATEIFEAHGDA